jgi:hypothetical protein
MRLSSCSFLQGTAYEKLHVDMPVILEDMAFFPNTIAESIGFRAHSDR